MASFGSGFSSGLGQGLAMGKMLMDTYSEYDQKDKLRKAGEESPTEIGALTKEQQITADHVKNADNGYEVQKLDNGGFQYRTAGSENDWTPVEPGAKKWKLGDQTRDTAFTQDEIDRYRVGKQAKVLMDAGDVKGAYGMKALAREDRKGQQWEDIADQERMFLTDMASSGGQLSEGSKAILTKAAGVYNQNQGRHNDGRILSYDWDNNQAIFTDTKTGDIVDRQPINGKTATFVGNEYFNHLRSALDPKFGLEVRNTVSGERKADAAVTSAIADMQYKGTGGVAERVGMAGINARAAGGSGGGRLNVGRTTITETDDQGVTTKTPVSVVTTMKNGVPVVQAYRLDGSPVTDKKALNQIGSEDAGISTSGRNADLGAARDAFKSGNMDYATYQKTVGQINQTHDQRDTLSRLGSDFKTVEKSEGRDAAVRSVVAQVEGGVKNPKDKEVVYGQLGIKSDEVLRAKREKKGGTGLDAATNYSPQSTWQPGQRRIPENMRGQ